MLCFSESQRFRQWWVWIFIIDFPLGTSLLVVASANGAKNPLNWLFTIALFSPVSILLIVWRLDTRYDPEGVHYRVFPFMAWRTIPWTDIRKAYVRQYGFVGYGIRWDFTTWYYNVSGNQGLQLVKKNGNQLLLGTQRPDELREFLQQVVLLR